MKSTSKRMLDKSIAAMISAIEIYNKPDFKYREESFVILAVNAWELLLKAKVLKDAKTGLKAIHVYDGKKPKRSRSGNPLTIDLICALRKTEVDTIVEKNLIALVEIRDTAIHFHNEPTINYVVYTLAVANLRNYQRLISAWFGRSLLEFNFFIMPLAFAQTFRSLQMLDLEKTPSTVANLVRSVAEDQRTIGDGLDFFFACEISTNLISAKKFVEKADLVIKIDKDDPEAKLTIALAKSKLDQYPLGFSDLVKRVQSERPGTNRNDASQVIKRFDMKNSKKFAAYSFRTKAQEEGYEKDGSVPKGTTSIYREDAVRFIVDHLAPKQNKAS